MRLKKNWLAGRFGQLAPLVVEICSVASRASNALSPTRKRANRARHLPTRCRYLPALFGPLTAPTPAAASMCVAEGGEVARRRRNLGAAGETSAEIHGVAYI